MLVFWIVSEIAAIATDLAEFIGGAIGVSLLLGGTLLMGMVLVAIATFGVLQLERRGFRPMERMIATLVGLIGLCYLAEMIWAPIDWRQVGVHAIRPHLPGSEAIVIAVGIVGATIMPHALYLHSGLTQNRMVSRDDADRRLLLRWSRREIVLALGLAGLINMAMVIMASAAFHAGHPDVERIETAYHTLTPILGAAASGVFLVSLIASGVSSSVVGTIAGQMIMQGFVRFHIPVWLRRLVTIVPAFVVVGAGVDPTRALVISQVVLSLALPVPLVALLIFTGRRSIMGNFANGLWIGTGAWFGAAVILALNIVLLVQTAGFSVPGL